MTKETIAQALARLASDTKGRSETARLRDVLPEIEAALAAGVSRAAVLDTLHAQGFTMGMKSFESALYRLRQRQKKDASQGAEKPRAVGKENVQASPTRDSQTQTKAVGDFQIPVPKKFAHNPAPDDSILD